jgi:hypothetical protein
MNAQWASDGVSIEARLEAILLGEYLEALNLVIEVLDGDSNTERKGVNENPTQGRRKWLRGKYPEVASAPALFE